MSDGGRMIDPDDRPGRAPKFTPITVTLETMQQTCAIDVAEDGSKTHKQIGDLMGLSREMVRQIERRAMRKLEALGSNDETPPLWRWRQG